jgi:hypothetical protein
MAESVQCDSCGAVLLEEDMFCGECGVPRSLATPSPESAATVSPATPPPTPPPPGPSSSSTKVWRIAVIVLGITSAILCLLGVAAFLLFGLTEGVDVTPAENWLYSTFCCLLPIAGTGAILAVAGLGIWWIRLRNRWKNQ